MEMRDYITIIDGADGQGVEQGAQQDHPDYENHGQDPQGPDVDHCFDVPDAEMGMDGVVSADQTDPEAEKAVVVLPQDGPLVKEDSIETNEDPEDAFHFSNDGAGSEQQGKNKGLVGESEDPSRFAEPEVYDNIADEMRDISDGIAPYLDSDDTGHETHEKKLDEEEAHSLENMEPSVDAEGHRNYSRSDGKSYPERNGFTG